MACLLNTKRAGQVTDISICALSGSSFLLNDLPSEQAFPLYQIECTSQVAHVRCLQEACCLLRAGCEQARPAGSCETIFLNIMKEQPQPLFKSDKTTRWAAYPSSQVLQRSVSGAFPTFAVLFVLLYFNYIEFILFCQIFLICRFSDGFLFLIS